MQSIFKDKLVPVALVAGLLGSLVGAFGVGPTKSGVEAAFSDNTLAARVEPLDTPEVDSVFTLPNNEPAYANASQAVNAQIAPQTTQTAVVYRNAVLPARAYNAPAPRNIVRRNETSTSHARRVGATNQVYVAPQPQKRSFWSKHQDKLTVALGTGAGAAIGGLIGGKKGALIGGLSGAGGSALYTYKIRKRSPRQ
jgi:hypothetical protein